MVVYIYIYIWVFLKTNIYGSQGTGKGEAIFKTLLYHFHPLNRNSDISRIITAEGSPMDIVVTVLESPILSFEAFTFKLRTVYVFYVPTADATTLQQADESQLLPRY